LHWWRSAAPRSAAYVESVPAAAQHLKRARRTFHRRLGSALEGHPSSLHRARKAAKRLRYSSELTEPALGNKAAKAGKRAKKMQTLLGEHQDATVSAELLRRLGAEAGSTPGHNGYTYGLLAAHEATRIARVRKKLAQRLGA
jgi:CHAD domain-containing protein